MLKTPNHLTHLGCLGGGCVLLLLSLLLLLLQFLDALLQYIRPKVSLKVRQFVGTGQPIFCCLLENVLNTETVPLGNTVTKSQTRGPKG